MGNLQVYVGNGAVEIDNKLVENAIRPTKLGLKNWMFIGSEGSGRTRSTLFTLIESTNRHGLEPYGYVKDLLLRLPESTNWQIPQFTPSALAKAKKEKAATVVCDETYAYDVYRSGSKRSIKKNAWRFATRLPFE